MKKMMFVLLAAVALTLVFASSAFAAWGDNTYLVSGGTSPHSGYGTATTFCGVCHAVHGASATGEALLASSRANSCTYCHITGGVYTTVYGGVEANYTADTEFNHGGGLVGCVDCHTVHGAGAMVYNGVAGDMILKVVDRATYYTGGPRSSYPSTWSVAVAAGTDIGTDLTDWCSGCHPYNNPDTTDGAVSHIMTANSGVAAFVDSTTCRSCHDVTTANGFPHYTPATAEWLLDDLGAGAATGNEDGVCIKCHQSGGAGVGLSF